MPTGLFRVRCLACLAAALSLGACAAPQRRPPLPMRPDVPLAGLPATHSGWPSAQWWKEFHDAQLDALIDRAMLQAPSLDAAQARYRSALAGVDAARADARPQITGLASASRARIDQGRSGSAAGSAQGAASAQGGQGLMLPSYVTSGLALADFSYDFDWWGKHRAAIESALDKQQSALAERSAAATLLQSGIANAYFHWLSIQLRLTQAAQTTDVNAALLHIAQARVTRGVDDPRTLENARIQLGGSRATAAQLEGEAQLDLAELAALCGVAIADLPKLALHELPPLDTALPDNAGVALLARRPDIVSSRWMVEASSHDVDAARAAFFPDVSVNVLAGLLRSYPTPGPDSTLRFGTVGLSTILPLYDGGRRTAQFDAQQAQLDSAIAQYNEVLVDAAQDVGHQVLTLAALSQQRVEKTRQVDAAQAAYAQAQARDARGVDDPRDTLSVQAQLIAQRDGAVQLDAQMLATNVALIHALGGGYRTDIAPSSKPGALPVASESESAEEKWP